MILVDTSVWIDHFRSNDDRLTACLVAQRVLCHPFVLGEIALGRSLPKQLFEDLRRLPEATVARTDEVLTLIGDGSLAGSGIGYVDAHLLAAARLTRDAVLWTRDQRLHSIAERFGVAWKANGH